MHRWVPWVTAAFLALLLVPAPAAAQGQLCDLQLAEAEENPGTSGFEPDAQRVFTFVVTNNGNADGEAEFTVQTSPPPGWFWNTQPQRLTVASGQSAEIQVPVVHDGSRNLSASLTVGLADIECSGPIAGGVSDSNPGNNQPVTLSMSPAPPAAQATDDDGTILPWVLFGAVVLGTAIAVPVYYQRNRVAIEALCEDAEREVVAGRGTSFPIVLRNKASEPVHVDLDVTEVKEGWSALTTLPDLELGPKESRTIYMMVRAPDQARQGDMCVAKLRLEPEGGSAETVKTVSRVSQAPGEETAETEES